jgi:hypothetical protein
MIVGSLSSGPHAGPWQPAASGERRSSIHRRTVGQVRIGDLDALFRCFRGGDSDRQDRHASELSTIGGVCGTAVSKQEHVDSGQLRVDMGERSQ